SSNALVSTTRALLYRPSSSRSSMTILASSSADQAAASGMPSTTRGNGSGLCSNPVWASPASMNRPYSPATATAARSRRIAAHPHPVKFLATVAHIVPLIGPLLSQTVDLFGWAVLPTQLGGISLSGALRWVGQVHTGSRG